jgi:uncharacterized protein (TIGR02246 family)
MVAAIIHNARNSGMTLTTAEIEISTLYQQLLDSWNERDTVKMAALYTEDASVVGFDGSQMNGRETIRTTIQHIFDDHQTATYIGKVREVRFLTPDVAILRAVVGMIPRGMSDINPATNAIQTVVSVKQGEQWRVALFQNTPAQFHGRPEAVEELSVELRQLIKS